MAVTWIDFIMSGSDQGGRLSGNVIGMFNSLQRVNNTWDGLQGQEVTSMYQKMGVLFIRGLDDNEIQVL
jgi:hypothetical protein